MKTFNPLFNQSLHHQFTKATSASYKPQPTAQNQDNTRNYGLYLITAIGLLATAATTWTVSKWTTRQQRQDNSTQPPFPFP